MLEEHSQKYSWTHNPPTAKLIEFFFVHGSHAGKFDPTKITSAKKKTGLMKDTQNEGADVQGRAVMHLENIWRH
jgi:hypothetical protein